MKQTCSTMKSEDDKRHPQTVAQTDHSRCSRACYSSSTTADCLQWSHALKLMGCARMNALIALCWYDIGCSHHHQEA